MRIRPSLTAGAIAAVAAIAFAVPGVTAAAQPAPQPSYHMASDQTITGKIAGVIPARGASSHQFAAMVKKVGVHAAPAAPAVCAEPNCPVTYHGGPVQHTPKVYVVFWGSKWNTAGAASAMNYLTGFYTGLGEPTNGDFWSGIATQYGDASGTPTLNTSLLGGTWVDTSLPANSATNGITTDELATEAVNAANHFAIADPTQADIVIASQQGTCFAPLDSSDPTSVFVGNCGALPTTLGSQFCAFHATQPVTAGGSSSYLPVTDLPYQPDAQLYCTFDSPRTVNDGFSIAGGHEVMEVVTDPNLTSLSTLAWDDLNDPSGGEIGDKCAFVPPGPVVTLNGSPYQTQRIWSNAANGCAITASHVTVTTPAAQSSTIGTAISPLQISATTNDPNPLSYTATGLPPGLSINKTTGVISGTPGVTAGTFTAKVKVGYPWASGTATFSWKVSSTPGNIKGWASKCVADYQAKTTAGARIVLWPCANTASMNITFGSNNQLSVVGRCITGTTTVFIEPCSAAGAKWQHWTRLSNGEYVLQSNGKCLTAPGQTNGLQLVMAACVNAGNQHWSLPLALPS
jgi:hypothetical protein